VKQATPTPPSADHAIESALRAPPARPLRRQLGGKPLFRRLIVLASLLLTVAAGYVGVVGRNTVFAATEDLRMWWDIHNGFGHGKSVVNLARENAGLPMPGKLDGLISKLFASRNREDSRVTTDATTGSRRSITWAEYWAGYLAFYDSVAERAERRRPTELTYGLDYSPLRLLIMSAWVKHTLDLYPGTTEYRNEFAWPLMHLNTAVAGLSAIAMFTAVLIWRRRCDAVLLAAGIELPALRTRSRSIFQPHDPAWMIALLAAVVLWLNPAVIIDSHAFVQWDTWILPFVIAGMGFAAIGKWGWAGIVWGASLGLKGQILLVMPALALIPMFRGNILGFARLAVGFCFMWLATGLPWLVRSPTAWLWVGTVIGLSVVFAISGYPGRLGLIWWLAVGTAAALVLGPFLNAEWAISILLIGMPLVAAIVLLPWMMPERSRGLAVGIVAVAAIFIAAHRFDGSWNWFVISYTFPSRQYRQMVMGPTANIPFLLSEFRWGLDGIIFSRVMFDTAVDVTVRHFLIGLHAVACVVCALGAAIQQKRNDPAMLLAMAVPWIVAYTVLPQMHERYLTWGAAVVGVGLAVSVGWGLLHTAVVGISTAMVFLQMLRMHSGAWPTLQPILEQLRPTLAGAMVLLALIYLYGCFARTRRV